MTLQKYGLKNIQSTKRRSIWVSNISRLINLYKRAFEVKTFWIDLIFDYFHYHYSNGRGGSPHQRSFIHWTGDAEMSVKASGGRQIPSYIRKPSLYGGTSTLIHQYTCWTPYTSTVQHTCTRVHFMTYTSMHFYGGSSTVLNQHLYTNTLAWVFLVEQSSLSLWIVFLFTTEIVFLFTT